MRAAPRPLKSSGKLVTLENQVTGKYMSQVLSPPKSVVSFDNREAGRSPMHSRSGYAQSVV